jgi:hypothetical protein
MSDTFTEKVNSITTYNYLFLLARIPSTGDTIASGFALSSLAPLTTGTYPIFGSSTTPTSYPAAGEFYADSKTNYIDSLATGSVVITKIDMTNKVITGTYSYTATGGKGSNPATLTVTNGQLNSITLQEF